MIRNLVVVTTFTLTLVACGDSLDRQLGRLYNAVEYGQIGYTRDYWLVKTSSFEADDRVALFFGFKDDDIICRDTVDLYKQLYPTSSYECVPAN